MKHIRDEQEEGVEIPERLNNILQMLSDSKNYIHARKELLNYLSEEIRIRKDAEDTTEKSLELYKDIQKNLLRFRFLVENAPLGISLLDKNNNYIYFNPKFTELFGYTLKDIPNGREWFRKAHPNKEYRRRVIENWFRNLEEYRVGEARSQTHDVYCRDGSIKIIHFRPVTMQTGEQIVFYADITELKNLEAQIRQAQKVESLGTLAGGMAHNFNNLLMGIQGNSSLALIDMDEDNSLCERLKNIEKLVQSGANLTRQLLGYARKGNFEINPLCLNNLIKETSNTFGITKREIRFHLDLCENNCVITANQGQIEQTLINIYVNAADAMPNGGDLFIKTEHVSRDAMRGRPYKPKDSEYVRLTVRDTGTGMDSDTMERIFDPFFTTKEAGKGTGLGLASVFGIVKSHNGYIDVESKVGVGATFYLYFPKSQLKEEKQVSSSSGLCRGSGTVLIADDEEIILEVLEDYLISMGYEVLKANGGNEAIRLYRDNQKKIDLVILDLIMPDMGGGETFDTLKSINPDIKVILTSGYTVNGKVSEILEKGCNGYIQKPFKMEALSKCISDVFGNKK